MTVQISRFSSKPVESLFFRSYIFTVLCLFTVFNDFIFLSKKFRSLQPVNFPAETNR